jgi:hypothetical protein
MNLEGARMLLIADRPGERWSSEAAASLVGQDAKVSVDGRAIPGVIVVAAEYVDGVGIYATFGRASS